MASIFLAFDEQDEEMGSFNQGCKEDFWEFLKSFPDLHDAKFIDSKKMNAPYISIVTSNVARFIFSAYSHGMPTALRVGNASYIAFNENSDSFKNAFFYTVSCHTASQLGPKLIENGCSCFIGYTSEFWFWVGYKEFSSCANFGLLRFIEGESAFIAFQKMEIEYDRVVDELLENDALIAAFLSSNKRGLKFIGSDCTIQDWANN